MSDTRQSERQKAKETYETPEMIVYGDVETLTRGSTPHGLTVDASSTPVFPSKVQTPTPKKP